MLTSVGVDSATIPFGTGAEATTTGAAALAFSFNFFNCPPV